MTLFTSLRNALLRLIPILLALILALGSFLIAQRSQMRLWDNSPQGSIETPDYFIKKFSWDRFAPTKQKTNSLQSDYAEHIPKDDLIVLKNIDLRMTHFEHPEIKMVAKNGELNNMNGHLLLTGNVTLHRGGTNNQKLWLNTEIMEADLDYEIIHAKSRPTLKKGAHQIIADEIIINNIDSELTALNSVNVTLAAKTTRN
jgi:LPS export ABC transporter protein LptC